MLAAGFKGIYPYNNQIELGVDKRAVNSIANQEVQLRTLFKAIENGYEQAGRELSDVSGVGVQITPIDHGRIGMEQALALFPQDEEEFVVVRQEVSGDQQGFILLMLKYRECMLLMRLLLNERTQLSELTELEEEAVIEVANIIINACLMAYRYVQPGYWRCALPVFERDYLSRIPHNSRGESDLEWVNYNQMQLSVGNHELTSILFWDWH